MLRLILACAALRGLVKAHFKVPGEAAILQVEHEQCQEQAAIANKSMNDNLLQDAFGTWWPSTKDKLRAEILSRTGNESMAQSFVDFIGAGLSRVDYEKGKGGPISRQEYITSYAEKLALGGRVDVPMDNLAVLAHEASGAMFLARDEAADCKTCCGDVLATLVSALANQKNRLNWSQGNLGPRVYRRDFLATYVNAMVSDALWHESETSYSTSFAGKPAPLEAGIFYISPQVDYPLHFHTELEAYYVLGGKTRFIWLEYEKGKPKLVHKDAVAGEWHFNPPDVPHAITTPFAGEEHLSLWFREGGPGQEANNKFGPKWIAGSVSKKQADEQLPDKQLPDWDGADEDFSGIITDDYQFVQDAEEEEDRLVSRTFENYEVGSIGMGLKVVLADYANRLRSMTAELFKELEQQDIHERMEKAGLARKNADQASLIQPDQHFSLLLHGIKELAIKKLASS